MKKVLISAVAASVVLGLSLVSAVQAASLPQFKVTVQVDCEDPPEWAKELITDGDAETFWHSQWREAQPEYPHWASFEFDKPYEVTGFSYLPRQDGNTNGHVKEYELYASSDGKEWGSPILKSEFAEGSDMCEVKLDSPVTAKGLKLVFINAHNEQKWAAIAEFEVFVK